MQPDGPNPQQHLSHISTLWGLVRDAHEAGGKAVTQAQERLMERYAGAVHRYLLGAMRDPDAADELFQEFSLRFLRGDFRNADPRRGRFRDFVKAALFHLLVDHQRGRRKQPGPLSPGVAEPAVLDPSTPDAERDFLKSWREELMARTWVALEQLERTAGQPHHTVLRFRADNPLLSSEELAGQVGARLGRPFSVHAIRQALHRAREKFADLLLKEVVQSLEGPTRERVEEELQALELFTYCREALRRRYAS
jgi:DNA-directed RNA polymerase specialized sigma24 family protein